MIYFTSQNVKCDILQKNGVLECQNFHVCDCTYFPKEVSTYGNFVTSLFLLAKYEIIHHVRFAKMDIPHIFIGSLRLREMCNYK